MRQPMIDMNYLKEALEKAAYTEAEIARILYDCYGTHEGNPQYVAEMYRRMIPEELRFALENPKPFEPLSSHALPTSGIHLGNLATGKLMSGLWPALILIFGATGTGKTNYLHFLLQQYLVLEYFIVFITYKIQEIPEWCTVFRLDEAVEYPGFPTYTTAMNIPPRGVGFEAWIRDQARAFAYLAEFHEAGEGYYREARLKAKAEFPNQSLTDERVLLWLKSHAPKTYTETYKKHTRNTDWMEIRRLDDPSSFFCSQGYDWEDWALNLQGVALLASPSPSISQRLKVYDFLGRMVKTREATVGEDHFPIVIIIDEAHVYCPRQYSTSTISEAANLFRRTRSCHMSVILTGHSPQVFDQMVLSNATAIVDTGVASDTDMRILANYMALSREQAEAKKGLEQNEAVVRCGSLPVQLVTVPDQHSATSSIQNLLNHTRQMIARLNIHPEVEFPEGTAPFHSSGLNKIEMEALRVLAQAERREDTFGKTRQGLMHALRLRDREVDTLRETLLRNGYVIEQPFHALTHGYPIFMRFTRKSLQLLKQDGFHGLRENVEQVSEPHWATVTVIAQWMKTEGCHVQKEACMATQDPHRDFRCDLVVAYPTGEKTIVEVVLSNSLTDCAGIAEGLRTQLKHFDFLLFVVEKREDGKALQKYLREKCPDLMPQIQIECAFTYFEKVWHH